MKKAIIEQYGDLGSIRIVSSEIPSISVNEVLVKVNSAGLNPKDILIRKGKFKRFTGNKFPQTIGFEFSGTVVESGDSHFQDEDHVFGMINGWKGRCCAEYVAVSVHEVSKIPEGISHAELAGVPLAGQTALQAIRNIGKLKPHQTICINGASGGVGTLAIQIAKALGGHVTTISSKRNTAFCTSLGADKAIAYDETDITKSNAIFDVFFDVFGNYSFNKIASTLNSKGTYITTVPKLAIFKEQLFNPFRKKKAKMVVVRSNSSDILWLASKIKKGKIKPIVDAVFSLDEMKKAQAHIESKRSKGKVIIRLGEPSKSPNNE